VAIQRRKGGSPYIQLGKGGKGHASDKTKKAPKNTERMKAPPLKLADGKKDRAVEHRVRVTPGGLKRRTECE